MAAATPDGASVVLVTGSSGFLGQHIVKLLQERDNQCTRIKLLDIKPYKNNLAHETDKPMDEIVADITDLDAICDAFEGVDCVIHSAAEVDIQSSMERHESINVVGTSNVIQACLTHGVSRLVVTSTVDVNTGANEIFNGSEKNTQALPSGCVFPYYANAKYRAERITLDANNKTTEKGNQLFTIVLRPTVMYGEEDRFLIYHLIKSGKQRKSKITQIGDGSSLTHMSYVGNVAWAHLVAKEKLAICPTSVGGEVYFITDDTEVANVFQIVKPYAEALNMTIADRNVPYWLVYGILSIVEFIVGFWNKFRTVKVAVPSSGGITYICRSYTFSRTKANLMLNYKPIYNIKESTDRSMQYYTKCKYD